MAMAATTENTFPASSVGASSSSPTNSPSSPRRLVVGNNLAPSSPLSGSGRSYGGRLHRNASVSSRGNSIDIYTAQHLFQRSASYNRFSSNVSLDLTLSSGAGTLSSAGGYTTSTGGGDRDYQTSFSLNSGYEESASASTCSFELGSFHSGKQGSIRTWGNYSVKFRAKNFVNKRNADTPLESVYKIGELLGEGGYGEVYRCWHLESGQERAVKVIPKQQEDHIDDTNGAVTDTTITSADPEVMKEFNILKECDHPNLLKVYECLEDTYNYYIVSDIITGGELYDELDRCGTLSEEDAKVLMTVLLTCINYCHQQGLVHRDLKPENILLEQNRDYQQLKIIDFGLAALTPQAATSTQPHQQQFAFTEMEGSKYYKSPQVLQGNYSNKCDIWSLGVIAYIMLGGYAPFDGETEAQVDQAVLAGQFDFDDEAWDFVSDDAKEFIMMLLTYDEDARPTAQEILQRSTWLSTSLKDTSHQTEQQRRASTVASLNDLQSFYSADSKLKQATCAIIASQLLSKDETEEIDDVFRHLDISHKGRLTKEDLKRSYRDYFQQQGSGGTGTDNNNGVTVVGDDEINELLKQVNFSGSGAIEYSEFVIAQMMEKNMITDDKLRAAFNFFDKEGKGYIDATNLKEVLQIDDSVVRGGDAYVTKKIIAQVDADGNGVIDFDEFKNMMFSRNHVKRLSNTVRRSSQTQRRRSSTRTRASLTKQQILEEIGERFEDYSEEEEEEEELTEHNNGKDKYGNLMMPPLTVMSRTTSSGRHASSPIPVAETVPEGSEEDYYSDDDSATEEEDLFGPSDDEEEEEEEEEQQQQKELFDMEEKVIAASPSTSPNTSPNSSPKRRKARSYVENFEGIVDSAHGRNID